MTTTRIVLLLLAAALSDSAIAQITDKEWQAKAVSKYPTLGVQGSEFNNRFINAYTQRRRMDPTFFTNPRWPLILADELALTPQAGLPAVSAEPQVREAVTPKAKSTIHNTRTVLVAPAPSASVRTTLPPVSEANKSRESEFPIGFVTIGVVIVGLAIWFFIASAAQRRRHRARLFAEAREYVEQANCSHALPTVSANIILKPGETAFYSASSVLYETRAVRHYQSGNIGFRVAKGVYLGGSRGRATSSQEWSKIDFGVLTVTNKRLIFDGGSTDRNVLLTKILSANSSIDGVEVSVENRQKSMVFAATNPLILATIIRVCCQTSDPLGLLDTPIQVNFNE